MNIKMLKAALAGFVLSVSSFANAGLITLTGDSADDIDLPTASLINLVSNQQGIINDLDFSINTTGAGYDLSVILTHIDTGTFATIWLSAYGDGGNLNGFNHTFGMVNNTFDDEATLDFHPNFTNDFNTSYKAVDLLSQFDGENLVGTWQLSITNTGCCTYEGQDLLSWSITADVSEVPEPSTLAIFALGIMGLASRRFKKQ